MAATTISDIGDLVRILKEQPEWAETSLMMGLPPGQFRVAYDVVFPKVCVFFRTHRHWHPRQGYLITPWRSRMRASSAMPWWFCSGVG